MIAKGISDYLATRSVGTFGVNMFVSNIPDQPDNCFTLFDEPAPIDDYMHSFGTDNFGVQVITRGSYSYARDKIFQIHKELKMLGGVTLDSIYIVDTQVQTMPSRYDNDEKGRREYTAHYIFTCNVAGYNLAQTTT